jgi:two-component system response regulator AtoC
MILSQKNIHLLLIEDEAFDVRRIRNTLKPFADRLIIKDITSDGRNALSLIEKNSRAYDVIIMDFQIAGGISGEKLIAAIKAVDPALQIIVVTKMTVNITDFDFANRLIEAGAMWYCTKYPGDIEDYIYQPTDFLLSIFNAFEKKRLYLDKEKSTTKLSDNISDILQEKYLIGESAAVALLRDQIAQCSDSDTTILVQGASGTGKELVATNIHYRSHRKFEKFVPINCGSLPHELIESELFGYEKGAFTGAREKKLGLFEVANNGTVFLDEVAELPPSAQVKLLRVLQEGEIDKIGRTAEKIKVNVRIIAATNKNIEEEVKARRFREDLYYRLNVVPLRLEPLHRRIEDIIPLSEFFFEKFSRNMGRDMPVLSIAAKDALRAHSWPGNVRELQNVIQRLLFIGVRELEAQHVKNALGVGFLGSDNGSETGFKWDPDNLQPLRSIEREFRYKYFNFVRQHTLTDAEAAGVLGLAPPNFHRMCKELGLK